MKTKYLGCVAATLFTAAPTLAQPAIAPAYQSNLIVETLTPINANPTQMAFGPDGRLYVMTTGGGVFSYAYNTTTGALTDSKVAATGVAGVGIAFHTSTSNGKTYMYVTGFDDGGLNDGDGIRKGHGYILKLGDDNGNGIYGESGELRVQIVNNLPVMGAGHNVEQLQVQGNSLYVGIGRRTINGRKGYGTMGAWSDFANDVGFWSGGKGTSWGDGVYNGTISMIQDLNTVADTDGSADGYTTNVLSQNLIQNDATPLSASVANSTNKLRVHSAGTRNPFGLCFDKDGNLWFTNNFNRTMTMGNGQAGFGLFADALDNDFSQDVHDQLFKAQPGADYGYWDDNWRPLNPMMDSTQANYDRVLGTTFDNLFNPGPYKWPYPETPIGLGPSSSSDGCGFFYVSDLPTELQNNIFIARWNTTIQESKTAADPIQRTLTYSDIVAVDTHSGTVRRVAYKFNNPIAVLWDGAKRLLIADYSTPAQNPNGGMIYALRVGQHILNLNVTLTRISTGISASLTLTNNGDYKESPISITRTVLGTVPPYPPSSLIISALVPNASKTWTNNFPTKAAKGTKLILTVTGTSSGKPLLLSIPVVLP